jgi:hypothetical protein
MANKLAETNTVKKEIRLMQEKEAAQAQCTVLKGKNDKLEVNP